MAVSVTTNVINLLSQHTSLFKNENREMYKAAVEIIENGLHRNDQELLLALRKIQENPLAAGKSSKLLDEIYGIAFQNDSENVQRSYSLEVKDSARATIQVIVDQYVKGTASEDLKNIAFSKDEKKVLESLTTLFEDTHLVARKDSGSLDRFATFMQRMIKSPNKTVLEAQVNKMLKRAGVDRSESGRLLQRLVKEKILAFFDNQIQLHHSDLPEYENLRNLQGDLLKLNRDKVFDIALRAAKEKCLCEKNYPSSSASTKPDLTSLPIKPKSEVTGYILLMLQNLPGTSEYRAAQSQIVKAFKGMGERSWLINDEISVLKEEREALFNLQKDDKGSDLTLHKINEVNNDRFLTVDERMGQVSSRLADLTERQGKFETKFAEEIALTNKFLQGIDKLTGHDEVSNLIRTEIFNALDQNGQKQAVSQWMSIDESFLKDSVEAQIIGHGHKDGLIQSRIINKLANEYENLIKERELLEIKQQDLLDKQSAHEREKLGLKSLYTPDASQADILQKQREFQGMYQNDNRNTHAQELSVKMEQALERQQKIEKLTLNLNAQLTAAQQITLSQDRDDYQPLINHIAKLRTVYDGIEGKSYLVDDLKILQNLLREDRAAYQEELVLFGKSLIVEHEAARDTVPRGDLQEFKNNINGAEALASQLKNIDEQLGIRLDKDQIFTDLQTRKQLMVQEIPALQASSLVTNLTNAGLITEGNSKEVISSLTDNIGEMFIHKEKEGLPLFDLMNSFVNFVIHYITETFANNNSRENLVA
jgi:hypothetical protein